MLLYIGTMEVIQHVLHMLREEGAYIATALDFCIAAFAIRLAGNRNNSFADMRFMSRGRFSLLRVQSFPKKDLQGFRSHSPLFLLQAKIGGERNL